MKRHWLSNEFVYVPDDCYSLQATNEFRNVHSADAVVDPGEYLTDSDQPSVFGVTDFNPIIIILQNLYLPRYFIVDVIPNIVRLKIDMWLQQYSQNLALRLVVSSIDEGQATKICRR